MRVILGDAERLREQFDAYVGATGLQCDADTVWSEIRSRGEGNPRRRAWCPW